MDCRKIVVILGFLLLWESLWSPEPGAQLPGQSTEFAEFVSTLSLGCRAEAPVLGKAHFRIAPNGASLHYRITVEGVEDITMAHLHIGDAADVSTPIVWLYPPSPPPKLIPGEFSGILAEGEITARDMIGPLRGAPLSRLVEAMRLGEVFVNIHGRRFAAGEICGRIQRLVR